MGRNLKFDILKTISIIGVVYIHSSYLFNGSTKLPSSMFRFGVPVFLMISFCLSEMKGSSTTVSSIFKRLWRIFLPFAFWSFVYFFINDGQFVNGYEIFKSNVQGRAWTGQYFFIVLLQLTVVYYAIKLLNVNFTILIVSFLLTSFLFLYNTYTKQPELLHASFYYWLFYLIFSIYIVRNSLLNLKIHSLYIVAGILFSLTLILFEDYVLKFNALNVDPYTRLSVLIASCISFVCFCAVPTKWIDSLPDFVLSQVDLISKYSLSIFCLNPVIIMLLKLCLPYNFFLLGSFYNVFNPYLFAVITLYLAVLAGKAFSFLKLDSLIK